MADHDASAIPAFVVLESALIHERLKRLSIARCREKSHLRSEEAHYCLVFNLFSSDFCFVFWWLSQSIVFFLLSSSHFVYKYGRFISLLRVLTVVYIRVDW